MQCFVTHRRLLLRQPSYLRIVCVCVYNEKNYYFIFSFNSIVDRIQIKISTNSIRYYSEFLFVFEPIEKNKRKKRRFSRNKIAGFRGGLFFRFTLNIKGNELFDVVRTKLPCNCKMLY